MMNFEYNFNFNGKKTNALRCAAVIYLCVLSFLIMNCEKEEEL